MSSPVVHRVTHLGGFWTPGHVTLKNQTGHISSDRGDTAGVKPCAEKQLLGFRGNIQQYHVVSSRWRGVYKKHSGSYSVAAVLFCIQDNKPREEQSSVVIIPLIFDESVVHQQ